MTSGADMGVVEARYESLALDELLAPELEAWEESGELAVGLTPTPLDRQPSAYVQVAWQERPRGEVGEVRVRALRNDDAIVLRLEWDEVDPHRSISDINVFADGCAVLFPANGRDADLATMGSPERPVAAWHWRAGTEEPFAITATGIGSVTRANGHAVRVNARWSADRWRVAIGSPLDAGGVDLAALATVPVAFAVWRGASGERAGLKSYSPGFHELRLGVPGKGGAE